MKYQPNFDSHKANFFFSSFNSVLSHSQGGPCCPVSPFSPLKWKRMLQKYYKDLISMLCLIQPCSTNIQTLYQSGRERCNATLTLITFSWDMSHPLFQDQLLLTSRRPFLITFKTKSYLRSETHRAYKFDKLCPKKLLVQREIFICA